MMGLRNLYKVFNESRKVTRRRVTLAVTGDSSQAKALADRLGAQRESRGAEVILAVSPAGDTVALSGARVDHPDELALPATDAETLNHRLLPGVARHRPLLRARRSQAGGAGDCDHPRARRRGGEGLRGTMAGAPRGEVGRKWRRGTYNSSRVPFLATIRKEHPAHRAAVAARADGGAGGARRVSRRARAAQEASGGTVGGFPVGGAARGRARGRGG
jgi:hypothetical protein